MHHGRWALSSVFHYGCSLYMDTRFSLRLHTQTERYCGQRDSAVDTVLAACLTFSTASLLRKPRHCCTGFFFKKRKKKGAPPHKKIKEIKWPFLPTRAETVSREQAKGIHVALRQRNKLHYNWNGGDIRDVCVCVCEGFTGLNIQVFFNAFPFSSDLLCCN